MSQQQQMMIIVGAGLAGAAGVYMAETAVDDMIRRFKFVLPLGGGLAAAFVVSLALKGRIGR